MELARQVELYNLCNPDEALEPEDARNVAIDVTGVRGARWSDRLARRIELSKRPVCQLFTGLRGTGKSTELRRLRQRLRSGSNLLTVYIDADDVLDQSAEIDVSDILSLVLFHAEKAVLEEEGRKTSQALAEGPIARLANWLKTPVLLEKIKLGPGSAAVEFSLKSDPTLRQKIRASVSEQLSSFVRLVHDELLELQERALGAHRSGLVIVFDSLEKLRGTSLTWKPVLDSAERIFSGGAPYLQLPVHVLYTIPPALVRRINDSVEFLPMIKVREKTGELCRDGVDVIEQIIMRRVPERDLVELFGPDFRKALLQLATWSGGYPREIVRLLQLVIEEERFPVVGEALEHVLQRAGNQYRGIVYDSGAIEWLARLSRTKKLIATNDAEREAADLFLQNNVVLSYLNSEDWYDVHPAVEGMPELGLSAEPRTTSPQP